MPWKLWPISNLWYNTLLYTFLIENCLVNCSKLWLSGCLNFYALILVVQPTLIVVWLSCRNYMNCIKSWALSPWNACLSSPRDAFQLPLFLTLLLNSRNPLEFMPLHHPSKFSSKKVPSLSQMFPLWILMCNFPNPWSSKEMDCQDYIFPSWDQWSWLNHLLSSLKSIKWPTYP